MSTAAIYSPRVRAMMASVLISTSPLPRKRATARAPPILPALFHADKADGLAVELEINLGVRKKACLLADFNGDGHLAF
jgi:hypothetical protein